MHFVYPQKILHKHCFQFILGLTIVPREIENNAYAKLLGVNKVHYGQCENGECCFYGRVTHTNSLPASVTVP